MPVNAISATTPTVPQLDSTPAASSSNQKLDQNMFLQLLVTQLKYQNPASPMDPAQLMQQTAQLTLVDKLNELVKLQEASSAMQTATLAGSIVGRGATYTAADNSQKTGVISAVKLDGDTVTLRIGSEDVPLTAVTQITVS